MLTSFFWGKCNFWGGWICFRLMDYYSWITQITSGWWWLTVIDEKNLVMILGKITWHVWAVWAGHFLLSLWSKHKIRVTSIGIGRLAPRLTAHRIDGWDFVWWKSVLQLLEGWFGWSVPLGSPGCLEAFDALKWRICPRASSTSRGKNRGTSSSYE